jgi:hypothetical protein
LLPQSERGRLYLSAVSVMFGIADQQNAVCWG